MAKNNKIQLFRTETSGSTTTNIEKGELALNINSSSPFIMFKDTSGTVQKLGSLSTSTGSSVFHTMTQKAITDALTARKNDTDILATSLTNEIAARKAVDGQTGQTYTKNTSAAHISAATSLNDADIRLNNAITAETKARQDAINALDVTDTAVDGSYVSSVSETDGKISVERVELPTIYHMGNIPTNTDTNPVVRIELGQIKGKVETVKSTCYNIASPTDIDNAINALSGTTIGNGTHVDVTVAQKAGKITAVTVAESDIASASALTNLINWCAYMSGNTTSTNVTSIPTTKRLCIATISSSQTLGVNGTLTQGRELHIIVKNNASSRITITIPSTFKNLLDENLVIDAGKYGEINLVSDGTNIYYRGAS
jgi:hypothetical protein